MDQCSKCGVELNDDNWINCFKTWKPGRGVIRKCRECHTASVAEYKRKNPERAKSYADKWRSRNPEKVLENRKKFAEKRPEYNAKWRKNNPVSAILSSARMRAKKQNVPFALTENDIVIPELCPVLGVPLKRNLGVDGTPSANSPSLDKFKPELGYVPGNIAVISMRANRIKNDATPDEIYRLAEWIKSNDK